MKKINDRMLGNRIRLAREARGMTQEELGKALGWEQSNVSKLERGVRKQLRLDELMQVVDILSVSVASLLPEWFADGDGDEATILSLYRRLPESWRGMAIDMLRAIVLRAEEGPPLGGGERGLHDV